MDECKLRSYIERFPVAFVGLRAANVYTNNGEKSMSELDEVPFLRKTVFPILIIGFIILKRLTYLLKSLFVDRTDNRSTSSGSYVFIINSTNKYRTHTFVEVGSKLLEQGNDVLFVCSPAATENIENWREQGFQVETFPHLLRFVSLLQIPKLLLQAINLYRGLRNHAPDRFSNVPRSLVLNMIFLELLKQKCFRPYISLDTVVNTYSLSPYLIDLVDLDHLLVHQHGLQGVTSESSSLTAMYFVPATYLLWGEPWVDKFERLTHPKSELRVVGSPWHDHLATIAEAESGGTDWDVLFLSASNSARKNNRMESYERLVDGIIEICEEHNFSLAIKLHPNEDGDWYSARNLDQYVHQFDDIEEAVLNSKVAITNASSAFIECAVMGTPVIVTDLWDFGLSKLEPVFGVHFTKNRHDIESIVVDVVESESMIEGEEDEIIPIGSSVDQILEVISDRE